MREATRCALKAEEASERQEYELAQDLFVEAVDLFMELVSVGHVCVRERLSLCDGC